MTDSPAVFTHGSVNIHYPVTGGEQVPGYLSSVNANSKLGLIVIQEWWGMNQSIQKTADEFAESTGHRALVPDLYRGKVAKNHEEAGHLLGGLNWVQAVEDIRGAAVYLKSQGCTKVAIVGFCMGGALVIASSFRVAELDAGICFYGIPEVDAERASKIKIPLLLFFGDKDQYKGFSDPEAVDKLEKLFKENNVNAEFVRYQDIGHAFMNRDRPSVYSADLAAQARAKSADFLKKHLA